MKKLLKVLGIASIFAAVLGFGFVACDNGGGSGSGDGDPNTPPGPGGNTVVDATWSFKTSLSAAPNAGTTLTADEGSKGASIVADTGTFKWGDTQGIKADNASAFTASDASIEKAKAVLKLVLDDDADVTIKWAITGTTDYRGLFFADSAKAGLGGAVKVSGPDLVSGNTGVLRTEQTELSTVKYTKLPAGTYYIGINGSYIESIVCSNQTFNADTKTVANTEDKFGIVGDAVSVEPADIVDVSISGGNVVITSKETGAGKSAVVKVSLTGSTSYALIPVSVANNGNITVKENEIEKVSFATKNYDIDELPTSGLNPRFGDIADVDIKEGEPTDVITLNNDGTCTTQKAGTTIFEITDEDGNKVEATVTVDDNGEISSVVYADCFILNATVLNFTATQLGLTPAGTPTLSADNIATAVVEDETVKVTPTATAAGSTVITVKDSTNSDDVKAEITVTVDAKGDVVGKVTNKYVDPSTVFPNVPASVTLTVAAADTYSKAIGDASVPIADALSCVGCSVTATAKYGGGSGNYVNQASSGTKIYAKISAAEGYLQIKPLVDSFQAGDVLTFDCYLEKSSSGSEKTFKCWKQSDTSGPTGTMASANLTNSNAVCTDITLTLAATDILDDGSIKIGRTSSGVQFYSVTVTRPSS